MSEKDPVQQITELAKQIEHDVNALDPSSEKDTLLVSKMLIDHLIAQLQSISEE